MSFSEALERQQAAIFARLGEDARWDGLTDPVRVIRREHDQDARFDDGAAVVMVRQIRVRKSEVIAPAAGQTVQLLAADGSDLADGLYTVTGEPQIDRKRVWTCPVTPAL